MRLSGPGRYRSGRATLGLSLALLLGALPAFTGDLSTPEGGLIGITDATVVEGSVFPPLRVPDMSELG